MNAPVDNRRWQQNKEAIVDKRQRCHRTGGKGANGVNLQRGEWQRWQQEGGKDLRRKAEVNFCFPIFWAKTLKKTWSVQLWPKGPTKICTNVKLHWVFSWHWHLELVSLSYHVPDKKLCFAHHN